MPVKSRNQLHENDRQPKFAVMKYGVGYDLIVAQQGLVCIWLSAATSATKCPFTEGHLRAVLWAAKCSRRFPVGARSLDVEALAVLGVWPSVAALPSFIGRGLVVCRRCEVIDAEG
jgi:hypothetical protein